MMTSKHIDPLAMITALAPREQATAPATLDAELADLWRTIDLEPATPFRARHPRVVAAGAAVLVAAAGVGTAAAAGVPIPSAVRQSWRFLTSEPSRDGSSYALADPRTAKRVFVVPGPYGTRFEGWTASNSHHGLCVTTVFVASDTAKPPADLSGGGGQCADADAPHGLFAEGSDSSLGPRTDRVHFVWEAGGAVRAELQVSTGRIYPVDIQNGWLGGWYTSDQVPLGATAVIVAYAADGTVLGRFTAQDQAGCPSSTPC